MTPVQYRFADDGVGEERIPVRRRPVGGEDQRPSGAADAFADQFVEVVGLGGGEVPHGEVVDDQQGWFGQAFRSRAVKLRSACPPASSASSRLAVVKATS